MLVTWVLFSDSPSPLSSLQWAGTGASNLWTFGRSHRPVDAGQLLLCHAAGSAISHARHLLENTESDLRLWNDLYLRADIDRSRTLLLAALGVIVVVQILRARKEANVLEQNFGQEYRQYRDRTWF